MKKKDIPKPRYGLGDTVMFMLPSEGNYSPQRAVGVVSEIDIKMTTAGYSIRYGFVDKDETVDESDVTRRVLACPK